MLNEGKIGRLSKNDLYRQLATLDEVVFNEIGLLLEGSTPRKVRSERILSLIHPLYEGIVSDEVMECANDVFEKFMKKLPLIVSDKLPEDYISISTKLGCKNLTFTISWTRVEDRKEMIDPSGTSVYRCGGKLIMLEVHFTIYSKSTPSCEYQMKIKDAILHELNHVYENMMMGHTYHNVETGAISQTNLTSTEESKRMLACILYASHEGEQDAMCVELYDQLLRNNLHRPKHSDAYDWLEKLYIAHDYLIKHKNDPELLNAIKEYSQKKDFIDVTDEENFKGLPIPRVKKPFDTNLGYKYFKRRADYGIKRFETRIAQTLKKAKRNVLGRLYSENRKYYLNSVY